jgi:hypothetical protein
MRDCRKVVTDYFLPLRNEIVKHFPMDGFEGYVGIQVGDKQLMNDILFSLLFVLFIVFSLVFYSNYHLFMKMIRDIFYVKDHLSLFDDIEGNEMLFRNFMIFQGLFLSSIAVFMVSCSYGYLHSYKTIGMNMLVIGGIFLFLFLFYLFKQFLYDLSGYTFAGVDLYQTWRTSYTAVTGLWGVSLYVPVLCLAFTEIHFRIPFLTFIVLYLLWRLVIIYKTVLTFNTKGVGFLYIILYLCAQEILPLMFLYEGIIYLYNLY